MKSHMKSQISSLLVGFLFAIGLGVSGMTNPEKVVSFLDIFGNWDPSLVFVMGGALFIHIIFYKFIMKRSSPLFSTQFHIPDRRDINARLITGSMLFGIGWGLVGYCPAPAITSLASMTLNPVIFVISMLAGMTFFIHLEKKYLAGKNIKWK